MITLAEEALTVDWRTRTQPSDDGQHLLWTGWHHNGTPAIKIRNMRCTVAALVYAEHHQRTPNGHVNTTCLVKACVQPEHLQDYADRQARYLAVAIAAGRDTFEGHCAQGHSWANAVFARDGRRRCGSCHDGQPPVVNDLAVEFALTGCPDDLARPDELEVVRRAICAKGLTHKQAARLVDRSPRTVTRWAVRHGWRKPT